MLSSQAMVITTILVLYLLLTIIKISYIVVCIFDGPIRKKS